MTETRGNAENAAHFCPVVLFYVRCVMLISCFSFLGGNSLLSECLCSSAIITSFQRGGLLPTDGFPDHHNHHHRQYDSSIFRVPGGSIFLSGDGKEHFNHPLVRWDIPLTFFLDESQGVARGGVWRLFLILFLRHIFIIKVISTAFCRKIKLLTDWAYVFVFYTSHNLLNRDVAISKSHGTIIFL